MGLGVSYCKGVWVLKEVFLIILFVVVVYFFIMVFSNMLIILLVFFDFNKSFCCIFYFFLVLNLVIIDLIVGVMVELFLMYIYVREVVCLLISFLWLL